MTKTMRLALMLTCFSLAACAADGLIPNRLAEAKVGEWILTRDISGETAGETNRYSVVKIEMTDDGTQVTLLDERFDPAGELVSTREIDIPLARYGARLLEFEDKAKQISRERLTLDDNREITVVAVTWDDAERNREIKVWMSREIPVGGFVKSWSSDPNFPAAEMVDFGEQ